MSGTPETDMLLSEQHHDCVPFDDAAAQLAELCRKLEHKNSTLKSHWITAYQERDGARRERDEARQQEQIHYDNLLSMQKERDDTRKQLAELKDWQESAISLLNKIQLQEIGGEIGAEPGEEISVKILPAIKKLKRERDQWRACAENLIDYARECLASLSGGCGHPYCEREMDTIRKDIARYERLKECGK